jgi:hypothetical protein
MSGSQSFDPAGLHQWLTGHQLCLLQGSNSQTTACSSATHPPVPASQEQSSGLTGTPRWADRLVCAVSSAYSQRTYGHTHAQVTLSGSCVGSCLPLPALPAVLMGRGGTWREPGGCLHPGDGLEGVRMGLVCCGLPQCALLAASAWQPLMRPALVCPCSCKAQVLLPRRSM